MTLHLPGYKPDWVVVDVEASGLFPDDDARISCVGACWPDPNGQLQARTWPFDQGTRDKLEMLPQLEMEFEHEEDPNLDESDWITMLYWLSEQRLAFHNSKYDLTMLAAGTREWKGKDLHRSLWWDTMLAAGVLEPTLPRGLDAAARRAGLEGKQGLDHVAAWLKAHKHSKRYDYVPWGIIQPYLETDVRMTAGLLTHQLKAVQEADAEQQVHREVALCKALFRMEQRGLKYDDTRSLLAAEKLEERADTIERSLPFQCTPTDAKRYFFNELKLEPVQVTAKGAPSINEEVVRTWKKQGVPGAAEYAEVAKIRKAVSMHYRGYAEKVGSDGRLRCSYRQGHVRSGRMSVERVQLQALPKKDKNIPGVPGVRELLTAEEGNGLWSLDFSQAELRVASKYAGCTRMLKLLTEGADLHGVTTEEVMGVSRDDPLWKEKRDIGKRLTFGSIFMIGGQKFQETLAKLADIHMPLEECNALVRRWRGMYPEFGVAYRRAEQTVKTKGYVRLLPNTEFEVRSEFARDDWPHTGWNRIVQGSLAEAFKLFLTGVEERWPGYAVLCIHDSVVIEAPLSDGARIAAEIQTWGAELMTGLFGIEMRVDLDSWYDPRRPNVVTPDRKDKDDDQWPGKLGVVVPA